ncbi:MAG: hypothetical protein J6B75_02100 [Ruminococcus sp.]|nr:hypothetical protein [Ruminococcus sp.]
MKREILFRGKKIVNGEWVEGNLFHHSEQRFIAGNNRNTEVIPETVGQYTGLTDRNGVKIFEGDIVKRKGTFYEVKYSTELTSFLAFSSNGFFNPVVFQNCEVIGNVHDNPELLKGEENG